mmetsp:Transcript_5556/g.16632  ORF Transcript_5556/g.16632 Transcript_5556/m.16632 type:complete len:91 (-) Transcript_5556:138-410(-)
MGRVRDGARARRQHLRAPFAVGLSCPATSASVERKRQRAEARRGEREAAASEARTVQPNVSAAPSVGPDGPESYTGRDKFPSQHPWFGYK